MNADCVIIHDVKRSSVLKTVVITWLLGGFQHVMGQVDPVTMGQEIVQAARQQIGITMIYDPGYCRLAYPLGDLSPERGVCTDVIIRALRYALKLDLQQCVHEDMSRNFSVYPARWGLSKPDPNIDHRRVPNLRVYLKRHHLSFPVNREDPNYCAGDLVTCIVPPNLPHIMIISDRKTIAGHPLIIHNIGKGTCEEDCLKQFKLTGHYRVDMGRRSAINGLLESPE